MSGFDIINKCIKNCFDDFIINTRSLTSQNVAKEFCFARPILRDSWSWSNLLGSSSSSSFNFGGNSATSGTNSQGQQWIKISFRYNDQNSFYREVERLQQRGYHLTYDSVCGITGVYDTIYYNGVIMGEVNYDALISASVFTALLFLMHMVMVISMAICGSFKSYVI